MVIEASREECFVMSLVENLARRNQSPIELIREVGALRKRGYSHAEIARKIGFSPEYVWTINMLLEKGEERLIDAVEREIVPHTIAAEIAGADDVEVQRALTDAYERGELPGSQILTIRRIVDERNLIGKQLKSVNTSPTKKRATTSATLVRAYQKEVERQKLLVRKAELTESRLNFIVAAMGRLLARRTSSTCSVQKDSPGYHSPSPSGSASRRHDMTPPIRISFEPTVVDIVLDRLLPPAR